MSFAKEKKNYLINLKKRITRSLQNAPEGTLKAISTRSNAYYYCNANGSSTYIRKDEIQKIKALAQKEYDLKMLKETERQIEIFTKLDQKYSGNELSQVFNHSNPLKKDFITPYCIDAEEKIRKWKNRHKVRILSRGEGFNYRTENGIYVRSKSERLIADELFNYNIPFVYQYPLILKSNDTIVPDFTVINPRTGEEFYFEHFEHLDDPDFLNSALFKILSYSENGFDPGKDLVITFETTAVPLDPAYLNRLIKSKLL